MLNMVSIRNGIVIENEVMTQKIEFNLPQEVIDIIKCKNPRCVTSVEPHIKHIFYLADRKSGEYRCLYCDEAYSKMEV